MTQVLEDPTATVRIEKSAARAFSVQVEPRRGEYVPKPQWETNYSFDLIKHTFDVKGPALCDEIRRDEDPTYVEEALRWSILSFVAADEFSGKRILDFGSGSGSSTMVLSRMFPRATEIVGVELLPEFVELARHRARFYHVDDRVSFRVSPEPMNLPADLGTFDSIVLSALWEHLLPNERGPLLSLLWRHLKPGGHIFLNQTPYRWNLFESHTTKLPFINFLPDRLAKFCANRLSMRLGRNSKSWETLLREGIRGGSDVEIARLLNRAGCDWEFVKPSRRGVSDDIGLWYAHSMARRANPAKGAIRIVMRIINTLTGLTMVPGLTLSIRKVG